MEGARGRSPTSAEVAARLLRAQARRPEWVQVREVTRSPEGRPLHAVTITDPSAPASEKQHVLMTAGHHGSEESGRLIALALLDWLLTPAAAEVRRRQKIVLLPNMNPDAAERDLYVLPERTPPMRDHGPEGPQTPEGRAFQDIARELAPEVYVDMHSRGLAGCSYDMVLWSEPAPYLEDDSLLHSMAAEMGEAGARAGLPNVVHPLSWPGFMSENPDVSSANAFTYRSFKSLSFLTETAESDAFSYPARDRARSGLARLKALLAWGNRRHPKLAYPGYPCFLLGMFQRGVVAIGRTTAARRRSRVDLWRHRGAVTRLDIETPERPDLQRLLIGGEGDPLPHGAGFQTAVRGRRRIASVHLNGRPLRPSETRGYLTWQHGPSTFVVVSLPRYRPGEYEIVIRHAATA